MRLSNFISPDKSSMNNMINILFYAFIFGIIASIPDLFRQITKDTGTNEVIRDFEISYKPCKMASFEDDIEKNMKILFPKTNDTLLFYHRNDVVFFKDGYFSNNTFKKVDGLEQKTDLINKINRWKICLKDIDFNSRNPKVLNRIDELKSKYDMYVDYDIEEPKTDIIKNITKLETILGNNDFLFNIFDNDLERLDFSNDKQVDELIDLIKLLKNIKGM
ncbi:hypothetical protein N5U17_09210 [Aliarcobacter butzleri]|uniref:hypothetical protein n=1 Tax=Aliarcobacter butzleri TaxID=28197 RepID=UPI0021B414E9|nr:hypothetical protein [Aliarcobacter butzleri]MCT7604414.1 hypothetical protein [Aliarcobacter butzleri]